MALESVGLYFYTEVPEVIGMNSWEFLQISLLSHHLLELYVSHELESSTASIMSILHNHYLKTSSIYYNIA